MEIPTQQEIDAQEVNEVAILKKIAAELNVQTPQVSAVVSLVGEGCTLPFIARYRKERHGNLDEVQIREIDKRFTSYKNLEERRIEVIQAIAKTGKLTESLYTALMTSTTLTEIEDLYAPFKKKRKTRGMVAIERGLTPLADAMLLMDDSAIEKEAEKFIKTDCEDTALNVPSSKEALQGAMDILAERVAQDTNNRQKVHDNYMKTGSVSTKGIVPEGKTPEEAEKSSNYQMYWDFNEKLASLKPHNILAINRAEKEGAITVSIDVDTEAAAAQITRGYDIHNHYHKDAVADGVARLLSPAVVREIRNDETDEADEHSISIFSENLRNLLMTQPIKGSRVLGIDPGIRTGTKCAALDETGKYLGYFKIFQVQKPQESYDALKSAIQKYAIKVVAVGNGTGSPEVQALVAKVIGENYKDSVVFTVVDESGASVYSASEVATKEFPDLDLTIRGAISMGRRLQDPLAELVKIDPKSIGVGLYQHDVNQKKLSGALDDVVESVVNTVGVNLNTASYMLLKYVSGITASTARKITEYRDKNGLIKSRESLKNIPGLGDKAFEQCAGFLKIVESDDPLDNTWVHPENYPVAREILGFIKEGKEVDKETRKRLCATYNIGDVTLNDIIEELKKPNRDPRNDCGAPIMQKEALQFENLKVGMVVRGKIRNVVDFGAFVDIGLHETALVHISQLSDSFVKDPMSVIKVGEAKDFTIISLDTDRRRIGLSLKTNPLAEEAAERKTNREKVAFKKEQHATSGGGKKVVIKTKSSGGRGENFHKDKRQYEGSSDGMKYNPFAALLADKVK